MRWLLLAVLVGCTTSEPESQCADDEPGVIFEHDNGPVLERFALAVGGTASIELYCGGPGVPPFDLPATATTEPDSVVSVDRSSWTVTLHALQQGTTTLRIADGSTAYGSLELDVEAVDHLAFGGTQDDIPPGVDVAFATQSGTRAQVILAGSGGDALADDAMTPVLPPGAVAVDGVVPGSFDYSGVPLGSSTIGIDSAGSAYTTPFVMVDHAGSVALVDPAITVPADGLLHYVGFAATLDGRFVTGLHWSFGLEGSGGGGNDDAVSSSEDTNGDGAISISASAGGASTTVSLPIVASEARPGTTE